MQIKFCKMDGLKASRLIITNLSIYSATHALVDGACGALIFGGVAQNKLEVGYFAFLIVLYNVLAFALQPIFGFMVDNLRKPAEAAALGCIFVTLSVLTCKLPLPAICLAGIGNALFHVGGGVISLNLKPEKAAMPGIYVAPGAIGLLGGILIGKGGYFTVWSFTLALIVAGVLIILIKKPEIKYSTESSITYDKFGIIIFLVLLSIAIRALVGFMLNYSWKADTFLLVSFTMAVVLGKSLGGILADRFGWVNITVGGLLVSALLLFLGTNYPFVAILGVFLFNLTMPVILVTVSNMFPGRAGYAFGLTTLALIIGSFPSFTGLRTVLDSNNMWLVIGMVLIMSFILYIGLKLYERNRVKSSKVGKEALLKDYTSG